MKLHESKSDFASLISLTSKYIGIPESAVKRDYYIVLMLQRLSLSEYADMCVFKGGTSLSKCYPNSINRFSEDVDLTFISSDELSDKQYSRAIKKIEILMADGFGYLPVEAERSNRSKSGYVYFEEDKDIKVKLEIGSSVRPDPYSKKSLKTYIQEYLESKSLFDVVNEFELEEVEINVLGIERTFVDKVMAVKRHAICGTLNEKVRHIYDVTKLFELDEIQVFISNKEELKRLLELTKETDSYYLNKRGISLDYNPKGSYDFDSWSNKFDKSIKLRYETLHEDLLYTDEKQDFYEAYRTFEVLNRIFADIGE